MGRIKEKCTTCEFQSVKKFTHKRILKLLLAANAGLQSCVCTNPHELSYAQFFAQNISMTRHYVEKIYRKMLAYVCLMKIQYY